MVYLAMFFLSDAIRFFKIRVMKKIAAILFVLLVGGAPVFGQTYFTKNGRISFFSKTILEDINAENNQVISVLDIQSGSLQFLLFNAAFHFPRAKMEEDFNEDYMESAKYPKSIFKGMIADMNKIDFTKDGEWQVSVSGDILIHGITRHISVPGKIVIKEGILETHSVFKILVKDYDIKIPSIVSKKISESVQVTVDCIYQKK